jgi:hypothetical protein
MSPPSQSGRDARCMASNNYTDGAANRDVSKPWNRADSPPKISVRMRLFFLILLLQLSANLQSCALNDSCLF